MPDIHVAPVSADFNGWDDLLSLLHRAFASMEGRIDPPSSLHALTADGLKAKAEVERLVLAQDGPKLIGCGFGAIETPSLYLSKLAVDPAWQRRGILTRMVALLEDRARQDGLTALTLQTRIELTDNHAAFRALGFQKAGETAHPGYDRPTSYTFRKAL